MICVFWWTVCVIADWQQGSSGCEGGQQENSQQNLNGKSSDGDWDPEDGPPSSYSAAQRLPGAVSQHSVLCVSVYWSITLFPHLRLSVGQWEHLSDSGVVLRRRFVQFYPQSTDSSGKSCAPVSTADRYETNAWYRLIQMREQEPVMLCVCVCVSACALQFLHEKNISHLDLKPQNILLSGNVLKLAGETCMWFLFQSSIAVEV